MPLFVYTRHDGNCAKKHDRFWRRCHCPKWIRGFLNGKTIRTTAKTRSWEAAEQKRNRMELNATAPAAIREARTLTLKNALAAFVSDAQDRNLATATVDKLKTLKRQFEAFADEQGLSLLCEVRVAHLRAFRSLEVEQHRRVLQKAVPMRERSSMYRLVSICYSSFHQSYECLLLTGSWSHLLHLLSTNTHAVFSSKSKFAEVSCCGSAFPANGIWYTCRLPAK